MSKGPALECQRVRQSNVKGSGNRMSRGLAKVCRRVWQRFVGGSGKGLSEGLSIENVLFLSCFECQGVRQSNVKGSGNRMSRGPAIGF